MQERNKLPTNLLIKLYKFNMIRINFRSILLFLQIRFKSLIHLFHNQLICKISVCIYKLDNSNHFLIFLYQVCKPHIFKKFIFNNHLQVKLSYKQLFYEVKKACKREQSCSIEQIFFYIDSKCTKICKFVKKMQLIA